jgi:hypothetical protein
VPLGRNRCIPESKAFSSFTGLPPWWSEVLFVCLLRPALARGLKCPFFSQNSLALSLTGFTVRKKVQKCLYLGHIGEFERV